MARARREELVDVVRQRVIRALATGAVVSGDRLASTRAMAAELQADPRAVAAAYRVLSAEGLVELRARSGIYVRYDAPHARRSQAPPLPTLVDMLVHANVQGYPAQQLITALERVVTRRTLRTAVLATTSDQGLGIARELHEDFGLDARAIVVEKVHLHNLPSPLRRAQLIVTTQAHATLAYRLAAELHTHAIVISVRSDLFETEWSLWHGQPVHVIVLDPRFGRIVQGFLRAAGADAAAVRVHLATDDLSRIAPDAPTYVTQAARTHLGRMRVPGMLIPPTRLFAEDCIRALWQKIGALNLEHTHDDDATHERIERHG
ncbi:hypothetical protein BH11GEM1_BH11GEM1_21670 [soil metagenome]